MRKRKLTWIVLIVIVLLIVLGLLMCRSDKPKPGQVKDEAMAAGRMGESFPAADEDYMADMDYGVTKDPAALAAALQPYWPGITPELAVNKVVKGRNNWNIWTGGNDRQWEALWLTSFGTIDLLKTVSNHPALPNSRANRWRYLGLVNEPCMEDKRRGRPDRFGLWLDERKPGCGPDPFENETKYPGVKIGARGKNMPVGSYYGYASGVMGLRLFPNPAFDEEAQKKWNAEKYYSDPNYYNNKDLVKPYRVGMACGFCHISHNPNNPPANPEEPEYANLNSNPGAQYFWVDRIFVWKPNEQNFAYQLFHCSRPGALDTSFVSSDQINNPRTMNAIYEFPARMEMAKHWAEEQLEGGERGNKQFNDYVPPNSALNAFYDKNTHKVKTPRVLKDGSDSVGALGALNRVYINIGLFSEEWFLHFIPLLGGPKMSPIPIEHLKKNSSYWNATEAQTMDVALFFLVASRKDDLAKAPGGTAYMSGDAAQLTRGKEVFAERCARCHSSKLPQKAYTQHFPKGCNGPNYLKCWDDYWQWTKTPEFKNEMKQIVMQPDFLQNNFLSMEARVPTTLLETNAGSPLATNAIGGETWGDFSSSSYKNLQSVGKVRVQNSVTGEVTEYEMPAGGRGYTRPPSLVSIWATAPFLQNNSLGPFKWKGDVPARMESFNESITQLLWPERRHGSENVITASGKIHPGHIDRLPEKAYVMTDPGFLPDFAQGLPKALGRALPNVFHEGKVRLGPFPKGTPVNLVSNVDMKKTWGVIGFALSMQRYLESVNPDDSDELTAQKFAPLVPKLMALSKAPDFIVNKGHYFGTAYLPAKEGEPGLSDADKLALIEFLKTF